MSNSFLITGTGALAIANDVADIRYRAALHVLPPGAQSAARSNACDATAIMVLSGAVEFMVNGFAFAAGSGQLIRIPAAACYAYRNVGPAPARILARRMDNAPGRSRRQATFEFAA
jgi:mannose-6-phosphate isomerase-like protein (cupin superfamily)